MHLQAQQRLQEEGCVVDIIDKALRPRQLSWPISQPPTIVGPT